MTAAALLFLLLPPLWAAGASALPGPSAGWASPVTLSDPVVGSYSYDGKIASDGRGTAIAVYYDWMGSGYELYARRYVSGVGWGSRVVIDTNYTQYLSMDMNNAGDAVVSFVYWNGTAYRPRVITYNAFASTWNSTLNVSGIPDTTYENVAVVDGTGQAFVAFRAYNATNGTNQLWGVSIRANGSVDAPQRLDNGTDVFYRFDMDASEAAGAIAAWGSYNGTNWDCYSMRHNGTAWQARRSIEIRAGACQLPRVEIDDAGTAYVIWGQTVNYYQIWTATSGPGGGWSAAQYAYSNQGSYELDLNGGGNGFMLTTLYNGSATVYAMSRYTNGRGFTTPVQSNITAGGGDTPTLVVDSRGTAWVTSVFYTGSQYNVRAVRFAGGSWLGEMEIENHAWGGDEWNLRFAPLSDGRMMAGWDASQPSYAHGYYRANLFSAQDGIAPYLDISSVYDGEVTGGTQIWLSGYVDEGAQVYIGGQRANVYRGGYWDALVTLTRGGNWIYAYAVDDSGNWGYSNYVYVTSTDPQPLLTAERAQAGKAGALDPMDIDSISYWGAWWPWIRTDRNGNAVAVWYEYSGYHDHAYFSHYTNGTGWATPVLLQGDPQGYLYGAPRVAMDDGGNATVVWATLDYNGAHASVYAYFWSGQYLYGTGPYRMDAAERFAFWPDVAVNPATGYHQLVWQQRDENTLNNTVWTRSVQFWLGFGGASRIENVTGQNEIPRIAYDALGHGVVGFRNWNGSQYTEMAARYNGTAWNQTFVLNGSTTNAWVVATGMDAGGNATFAWRQYNGSVYNQFAARLYANGTFSGPTLWLNSTWDWDAEVNALANGQAFISMTADRGGQQANAWAGVSGVGTNVWTATVLDANASNPAGGPKFSKNWDKTTVRAHFDEYYDGYWHPTMREYNVGTGAWGPAQVIGKTGVGGHIPDVSPMPDGGYMSIWVEDNTTLGFGQVVARRVTVTDTTPPALTITNPANGSSTALPYAELRGSTEVGARVYVGNLEVPVAANGSFGWVVPLVNGTNAISVRSRDINGVWNNTTWLVVFNDPAYALIANLTAQNLALQAAFIAANNSLWAALAGQNASLLGQIAATNASLAAAIAAGDAALLAQLIATNSSLSAAIASGDAALLADLIAQNSSLSAAIASGDASLLASLLAQNASLLNAMAAGDAALVASLASQNASLLATIASTNATLLGKLAAQNASVMAALSSLNSTLLAELASQDAELTSLIANTNATLLAELATQNSTLRDLLAAQNLSLLASLAAQNSALLGNIASTNATLLAQLASQNATLYAKLTADNNALWNSLNATNQVNSNQNSTLQSTQDATAAAQQQAASASTMALIGTLLGAVGLAVAALAVLMSRKRPPSIESAPPPSTVEPAEVATDAVVVPPAAPPPAAAPHESAHGHSMAAQGELGSGEA